MTDRTRTPWYSDDLLRRTEPARYSITDEKIAFGNKKRKIEEIMDKRREAESFKEIWE